MSLLCIINIKVTSFFLVLLCSIHSVGEAAVSNCCLRLAAPHLPLTRIGRLETYMCPLKLILAILAYIYLYILISMEAEPPSM